MATGEEQAPRLLLGLGNPGMRYRGTRHNVGFEVVAEVARRLEVSLGPGPCNCQLGRCGACLLAQPQTYMNRSGYAARCLVERYTLAAQDILVIYDEIHLPLGRLRLRPKGSPGGHRGMESVLQNLGTDQVPRLRLGIRPAEDLDPASQVDFVLGTFDVEEAEEVEAMVQRAADACELWFREGAEVTMQQFNG